MRWRASSTRGAHEIVLTGVDITRLRAAGSGTAVPAAARATCRACKRLRLSSLDSIEIDDALLELVAGEPRLLPHFHLSLQAGDDLILKRMKRRHSRAEAVATVGGDQGGAARRDDRRRPDRRLSDRKRGGGAQHARVARRLRHRRRARLSLLAAPRHTRRAHAAGRARDDQGPRRAASRRRRRRGARPGSTGWSARARRVLIENNAKGHSRRLRAGAHCRIERAAISGPPASSAATATI